MKAIVEFGIPKSALDNAPCAIDSGSGIPFDSTTKAAQAAVKIAHVLFKREDGHSIADFTVSKAKPRLTVWNKSRSAWVTVSLMDGVMRGDFGGSAEAKNA